MHIDGETLIVVNEGDSLLFEDYSRFFEDKDDSFSENKEEIVTIEHVKKDVMMPILNKLTPFM